MDDTISPQKIESAEGLLSLPAELILKVLDDLTFRDILHAAQTCKTVQALTSESTTLQYKIILGRTGQQDRAGARPSLPRRLEMLQRHEKAWESFRWLTRTSFRQDVDARSQLSSGVWAHRNSSDWKELSFFQLPSLVRGVRQRKWTYASGFQILDFAFDASTDLLVLLEWSSIHFGEHLILKIHLRSLSTGGPHPRVIKDIIELPLMMSTAATPMTAHEAFAGQLDTQIRLSGDALGIKFYDRRLGIVEEKEIRQDLSVWDWITGECKLRIHSYKLASFTFLSERHILVAYKWMRFELREAIKPLTSLAVYDFTRQRTADVYLPSSVRGKTDCEWEEFWLMFPPGVGTTYGEKFALHIDPSPTFAPDDAAPFHIPQSERMLVVELSCRSFPTAIFIPHKVLLTHVNKHPIGQEIRWEEWGQFGTAASCRLRSAGGALRVNFPSRCPETGVTFGMRYVRDTAILGAPSASGSPLELVLLDFHPARALKARFDDPQAISITEDAMGYLPAEVRNSLYPDGMDMLCVARRYRLPDDLKRSVGLRFRISEDAIVAFQETEQGDHCAHFFIL